MDEPGRSKAFDLHWNTNYANTKILTEKVLNENLVKTNGKIIFVSSYLGRFGQIASINPQAYSKLKNYKRLTQADITALENQCVQDHKGNGNRRRWPRTVYHTTKIFMSAYANVLSRDQARVVAKGIQVYPMHPGWCRTDMMKAYGSAPYKSQDEGAETALYLCDLPYVINHKIQGEYFADSKHGSLIDGSLY